MIELFECELSNFGSSNYIAGRTMSALLDGLLGSFAASSTKDSEMSGSFQSGVGVSGSDYEYGGSGIDRSGYGHDHYGGHSGYHHHSGYHEVHCCPLVVDPLCLAAILGAIAGATVFLARTFQIELTGRRRRKREIEAPFGGTAGFYLRTRLWIEGKKIKLLGIGAVAGATVFLARTFQIELCNLAGQGINNCVGRRRRKREIEVPYNVNDWSSAGLYGRARIVMEGKILQYIIHIKRWVMK